MFALEPENYCPKEIVKYRHLSPSGNRALGSFPLSSAIKIVFLKHVVLIMWIIIGIIINMDDIGQKWLSEGPILSLNKRLN